MLRLRTNRSWPLLLGMGALLALGCNLNASSGSSGSGEHDSDIFVVSSTDDGVTWTDPVALNAGASTDAGGDWTPQLTTDTNGEWIAVWRSTSFFDPVRLDPDILLAHLADDGETWTDQAELNTNANSDEGADSSPQLASDGQGAWVAIWSSTTLGDTIGPNNIYVARSTDDGDSWSAPAVLSTYAGSDAANDVSPQIATDGLGTWIAVWTSDATLGGTASDLDLMVARSTDDGINWSAPTALNTNACCDGIDSVPRQRIGGDDSSPQVTFDGQGTWIAVWTSDTRFTPPPFPAGTPDFDIVVARSINDGIDWSDPTPLNPNDMNRNGEDRSPQLTTDGQATWIAVWTSDDALGDTLGTDHDILMMRSPDGGANWSAPAALNTNAGSDAGDDDLSQLTTNGLGTWIAVWTSTDALGGAIGTDSDILVARSTDDGVNWSAPVALKSNADDDGVEEDTAPQLTTDGAGTWIGVWQSGPLI